MSERSRMIEWIRGEIVGPSRNLGESTIIDFSHGEFFDPVPFRRGPIAWQLDEDAPIEEILYYDRESPFRKYGTGLLHPLAPIIQTGADQAMEVTDTIGADLDAEEYQSG